MTIMATHFALVLGAWRLRVRIDIDEPRESELDERAPAHVCTNGHSAAPAAAPPHVATWGRG